MARPHSAPTTVAKALLAGLMLVVVMGCSSTPAPESTSGEAVATSADSSDLPDASIPRAPLGSLVTTGLDIAPRGDVLEQVRVERVVDGDTFKAIVDGELVSVRVIGFDTPESVKPGSPIECFGPESSAFAIAVLTDADVTLEFDETQGRFDRFGRVLAHVWVPTSEGEAVLYGAEVVAQGFGEERQYGDEPTAWTALMRNLEQEAQTAGLGLWGTC